MDRTFEATTSAGFAAACSTAFFAGSADLTASAGFAAACSIAFFAGSAALTASSGFAGSGALLGEAGFSWGSSGFTFCNKTASGLAWPQ